MAGLQSTGNRTRSPIGLALIGMVAGLVLTTSCKKIELNSSWATAPMLIDGQTPDWKGVTSHFLEESEASVAFANDSSRLNILLRTRDPRLASVIRRSGLTFWVNAQGNQERDFVIRYRGGPTREEMSSMTGRMQHREFDREPEFMTPDTGGASLTCFVRDRIVEMEIPLDGSTGPAAAYSLDEGFFTYEFSLPLHESAMRSYGLAAVPGQTIRIGAAWGGEGRGLNPDLPGPAGLKRSPPTGGGFGGRGGRGGGRRGDSQQKRPQPMTSQDIQMRLKLAESRGT